MGWSYYDIKEYVHHPDGLTRELEHCYWQVSLMCHLLRHYPYGQMYEAPVHEAMMRFQVRVLEIDDEQQHFRQMELKKSTKKKIHKEFVWLADYFKRNHPSLRMRDLYTAVQPVKEAIEHFDKIQDHLAKDTSQQSSPSDPGEDRFTAPCQMCMPFLDVQKKVVLPIDSAVIDSFIAVWGAYDLAGIYRTPASKATRKQVAALWASRKCGALSSSRGTGKLGDVDARTIEFKNNLKCSATTLTCQPFNGGYCVAASDGSCSAMKDLDEETPGTGVTKKKRPQKVG